MSPAGGQGFLVGWKLHEIYQVTWLCGSELRAFVLGESLSHFTFFLMQILRCKRGATLCPI